MCRDGVNLTQFKLSVHQLEKFSKTLKESLEQWENLLNPLGFENLSNQTKKASEEAASLQKNIARLIELASDAEASEGDDVTITPL